MWQPDTERTQIGDGRFNASVGQMRVAPAWLGSGAITAVVAKTSCLAAEQGPAVSHFRNDDPEDLGLSRRFVAGPSGPFVEVTRALVLWMHPEDGLGEAKFRQLAMHGIDQRPPGARPPVVGIHVDGEQLAHVLSIGGGGGGARGRSAHGGPRPARPHTSPAG